MPTNDDFLFDVAAIRMLDKGRGRAFGSGRLIAPNLVLTAGHVVDYPKRQAPSRTGWQVRLIADLDESGARKPPPHDAELIWRGSGELDMALLRLRGEKRLEPKIKPHFTSYELHGLLGEIFATGFPNAWVNKRESIREYKVSGNLRISSRGKPYDWNVMPADKPDSREGWKGMSGAGVYWDGPDGMRLFGVVQDLPAQFSEGKFSVARISEAFKDGDFRSCLRSALGYEPILKAFVSPEAQVNLGIAKFLSVRTEDFKDEYLTSEKGSVPFGGRDEELNRLDAWLCEPQSEPRILVTAPAGRGKSALLVQWMKSLQDGGACGENGWQLAFIPISIRSRTNRPEVFYEGLARRLAEILQRNPPTDALRTTDGLRDYIRDLLNDIGARRILIVVDGLDEALGNSFDARIFPKSLPKNLRILLSARWLADDHNSEGWLTRLEWNRGVKVVSFELEPLTRAGVADVFVRQGAPADIFTKYPRFLEKMVELTEGEPLLIRCFTEDLWDMKAKGSRMTPKDFRRLKPGFESYFESWFERQNEVWKVQGVDLKEVDKVLRLLAFARGPLEQRDLSQLMKIVHHYEGVVAVDRLIEPLSRWMWRQRRIEFGEEENMGGYILSHPKIADYLRKRFDGDSDVLQKGYFHWCLAHVRDVNHSAIPPEKASAYVLQAASIHFKEGCATRENFMLFVENGWRRAWLEFEGGARGFGEDVRIAWNALKEDGSNLRLGSQWRCALTLASIKSQSAVLSPEVLLAAIEHKKIPVKQVAYLTEFADDWKEDPRLFFMLAGAKQISAPLRARFKEAGIRIWRSLSPKISMRKLAPLLPPELHEEALSVAMAEDNSWSRAVDLTALGAQLPQEQQEHVLMEALAAASANTVTRTHVLVDLVKIIPLNPNSIGQVIAAAPDDSVSGRRELLEVLTARLPLELFGEAFAVAKGIFDEGKRADVLAALSPRLPDDLLGEVFAATMALKNVFARATALVALAPRLTPTDRLQAFGQVLAVARTDFDERFQNYIDRNRSRLLIIVAPQCPSELLGDALAVTENCIDNEDERAEALAALATRLPENLLGEAFSATMALKNVFARATALVALAPRLTPTDRLQAFGEVLAVTRTIVDRRFQNYIDRNRSRLLIIVAPQLPPELFAEAIAVARQCDFGEERARALAALAPRLPENFLGEVIAAADALTNRSVRDGLLRDLALELPPKEALIVAQAIHFWHCRSEVIIALVPRLPQELLRDAINVIKSFGSSRWAINALAALTPQLLPDQLSEAVAATKSINDEYSRSIALGKLAILLPEEQRRDVLSEVFTIVKAIKDNKDRGALVVEFASYLPEELVDEVVVYAKTLGNEGDRAAALAALAPRLSLKLLTEVLAFAKTFNNQYFRSKVLFALAPFLPLELLSEAILTARGTLNFCPSATLSALARRLPYEQKLQVFSDALASLKDMEPDSRGSALSELIPELPAELLNEALVVANTVQDRGRAGVLIRLAPRLPLGQQQELLREALGMTRVFANELPYTDAFTALMSSVPEEQKREVINEELANIESLTDKPPYARKLAVVARFLPEQERKRLLNRALDVVQAIDSEQYRLLALADLAPYLPTEQRLTALEVLLPAVKALREDSRNCAEGLKRLMPILPPQVVGEALAIAGLIGERDGSKGVEILMELAPKLTRGLFDEALTTADRVTKYKEKYEHAMTEYGDVLVALLAKCDLPRPMRCDVLLKLIDITANIPRRDSLRLAGASASSTLELSDREGILELISAIRDVCSWYP